jgi:hypothetical protein
VLLCVPWLWTLPPCSGGLRRCHASYSSKHYLPTKASFGAATCPSALNPASLNSGPRLPAQEGSDAATCPSAPDPASLLGRAPALPRVPWLRILPLCSGGLWNCHVSLSSGPYLPT